MEIYNLKTDGESNPIGLDSATPTFSWKLKGDNEEVQREYQIYVAIDENFDLIKWDSGLISSNSSFGVVYCGSSLNDCTKYFWKVKVNEVFSKVASFETAFINPENFKAEWIGMPLAFSGYTDVARLEFTLEKPIKRARFYLSALGCARVSFNGGLVDDAYFDGSISVYEKLVYYRAYALEKVKIGLNALAVEMGYGYYGAKKMYGVVFLEYEDGSTTTIPTICGRVWMITHGSITSNSIYGGEHLDARMRKDFSSTDFLANTTDFVSAYAVNAPGGKFKSCPIPPMRIVEKFAPRIIKPNGKNMFLVDAGINLTGFIKVLVSGVTGSKITISYAEVLDENGNINKSNLRRADCVDEFILAGEKEEAYAPCFTYHGFRYVQITCDDEFKLLDVEIQHLRTDIEQVGEFTCSDMELNALHKMAIRTESNNLNGIFTDCPQRDERLGWLNDMTSRIYQSLCNFDLSKFLPNYIDLITLSASEDGAIGDTVPFYVGSKIADPVSAYNLLALLAMRFYGDIDTLKRNYKGLCLWLNKLEEFTENDVLSYGLYGDWCPANAYAESDGTHSKMVSVKFMSSAYFVWYHEMMRELAKKLGDSVEEQRWAEKEQKYRDAFNAKYKKENGLYGNGSQTECAVAMTIFKDDTKLCELLARHAIDDVIAKGYHTTCGNQGYRHLFYRLSEYGYVDELIKLLKNPEYPGWGNMLSQGATSVWERWECKQGSDMHSYNHPMFGSYDGFFYNYLAGIRTNKCENAFGKIVIEPCFATQLEYVKAKLETIRGTILVEWRREKDSINLKISTPANTTLKVIAKGKIITFGENKYNDELILTNGAFELSLTDKIN